MHRHRFALSLAIVATSLCASCPTATASFISSRKTLKIAEAAAPCLRHDGGVSASTTLRRQSSHQHFYARNDNLVAGIAEMSVGTSLGVLWSEFAIIATGCGPVNFSDSLERFCYQAVIVAAGLVIFTRIVTGRNMAAFSQDVFGELQDFTLVQIKLAEWLSLAAVLGALVALGFQMMHGQQMDGLSGIDVQQCRAIREL